MGTMTTQIVGQKFYQLASKLVPRLKQGQRIALQREPTNQYDANAIAVFILGNKVGHLSRGVAENLAPMMDAGVAIIATKTGPMGGMIKLDWDDEAVFRLSAAQGRRPKPVSPAFKPPKPPTPKRPRPIEKSIPSRFEGLDFSGAVDDEGPDPWL
jgi:hypothetical protein